MVPLEGVLKRGKVRVGVEVVEVSERHVVLGNHEKISYDFLVICAGRAQHVLVSLGCLLDISAFLKIVFT